MMSSCREIELEIVAYCSGELEPAERDMVRQHLDGCPACRAELGQEMELRRTLGTLPAEAAPAVLEQRIKAATRRPERNRRRLTAALALAAASLAIALILPAMRPAGESDGTWSDAEIAAARQEVMYTLALTARVIGRTEKTAVVDVFADKLPRAIDQSFKMVKPTTSGGNG